MKIAMMGSGGVGGYFGALLAKGGAEVHFIARGAHLAAMRANGLTIEGGREPLHLAKANATDDPSTVGPVDLVIVSVKLWDTDGALAAIRPLVGPDTAILSLQNGVMKDELIARVYPRSQIMGGVVYVATTIARPGVIARTGALERLIFGEYAVGEQEGTRSARAEALLAVAKAGGINAEISPDIGRDIWQKFVFLAGLSGATATMRSKIGPIRSNPQTRAFLLDVMREVVAVGRASGIALPEHYAEERLTFADGVSSDMTSSLHHDLERGNRLEVRWLAGGVVEIGKRVGVPTPLNRAIADILALHERGRSQQP